MSLRRSPEQQDLLGEALRSYDQNVIRQENERRLEQQPCPPDPELEALFKDFAQRMPRQKAVPFVRQNISQSNQLVKKSLWSGKTYVEVEKKEIIKITSGWPIYKIGDGHIFSTGKYGSGYVWHGLAIDIDAQPWLSSHGSPLKEVRVEGFSKNGLSAGRPKGPDLREAIMKYCSPMHGVNADNLPTFLAQGMAEVISQQ
jgi:hypothetical protein